MLLGRVSKLIYLHVLYLSFRFYVQLCLEHWRFDVRGNQQLIKHQIKTKIFTLSSGAMFLPAAFQNNYAMEKTEPHSLRGYTSYILNKVIKTMNSFLLFHVNELII